MQPYYPTHNLVTRPWTGALEFIPAMVYPEKARVWIMGADGIKVQEGPKELPWTENAADKLPQYPFISGAITVTIRSSRYLCNIYAYMYVHGRKGIVCALRKYYFPGKRLETCVRYICHIAIRVRRQIVLCF